MKLSLAIIFKDEVDQFKRILEDYEFYFDEIVIAVDKDINKFEKIAKKHNKVKIYPYKWINDFADKRNFLATKVTGEYYLRMDADDAIENPIKIRQVAEDALAKELSIVYFYYVYSKDKWGNINAAHWREGLIRNSDNLYWNKKIHENILPKDKSIFRMELNEDIKFVHLIGEDHAEKSLARNITYLLEEFKQDGDKTDPRTVAYLGRMLHGIGQFGRAVYFLELHIQKSGWDEDRYYSWCILADCYKRMGRMDAAIASCFEALQERPDYPDAYLKLHDIYFEKADWEKSLEWGKQGLLKPIPKTFLIQNPSDYTWLPAITMAHCYFELNDFDKALQLLLVAKQSVPTLDYIQQNEPVYREAVEHKNFMEKFLAVVNYLRDKKEEDKVVHLLNSTPKDFDKNEVVIKLKQYYLPPKVWDEDEVTIFACSQNEKWSPKSVEGGIGGSEEAVIYLSEELVKLGYKVTVYNECGDDNGVYNGVIYKDEIHFNPSDKFNILISWRNNIFNYRIQARNKIIWLHDIPTMKFTEDENKTFDNIVVLSKFHASLLPPQAPKEKIFYSTNGINAKDFVGLETIKREPHRVIYASSYNRGLETLLEMWPDIRKEVPDATLHCYYGWDVYDKYVKNGWVKDSGFKAKMQKLLTQEGVTDHGRIGHKELLKEYSKSGVFAYPCQTDAEINCIALTKAVACGCRVVTSDYGVMAERSPNPVPMEKFKDALIKELKDVKSTTNDVKNYINDNSWGTVASEWSKNLFPILMPTEVGHRIHWALDKIKKEEKIIDIGANDGHIFDGWDRKNITSVDIDKYEYEGFVQADAANLPFPDKLFDVALLGEIVEHVPDPIKVLSEARRVAKRVIVTVPYEYEWPKLLKPFGDIEIEAKRYGADGAKMAKKANPRAKDFHNDGFRHLCHERCYTPETFKQDLERAGFSNVKVIKLRSKEWCWLGFEGS